VITTGANKIADADVIMVLGETAAVADATTAFALAIKAEATTLGLSKATVAHTTTAVKTTVANKKEDEEVITVVAETKAKEDVTTASSTTVRVSAVTLQIQ
jgi:hypothetical protein